MKDRSAYYSLFKSVLQNQDTKLADEFERRALGGTDRSVFLWLEDLRLNGKLPKILEQPLTDFYGLYC